jgi:hypothetical protein
LFTTFTQPLVVSLSGECATHVDLQHAGDRVVDHLSAAPVTMLPSGQAQETVTQTVRDLSSLLARQISAHARRRRVLR